MLVVCGRRLGNFSLTFCFREACNRNIACGSLRLGTKIIPYLNYGNYLGIEKENDLIRSGLDKELEPAIRESKQPNILLSDSFEFEKFGKKSRFCNSTIFIHSFAAKPYSALF